MLFSPIVQMGKLALWLLQATESRESSVLVGTLPLISFETLVNSLCCTVWFRFPLWRTGLTQSNRAQLMLVESFDSQR